MGWDGPWVIPFQYCVRQPHPTFKMVAVTKNRNFFSCQFLLYYKSNWTQILEYDGCFRWQHRLCNSGNFNFFFMSSNLPDIKDKHTEKPKDVLQHSGTVTRKRLSACLSFCLKLATSLRHQYFVLQHSLTLTKLI